MRLSQAWIVATKDFATFRTKKNILYSIIVIPLVVSVALPGVIWYAERKSGGGVTPAELEILLPALTFFFLVIAGFIPTTLSSYSLVGEKVEKSIEPLLATPTTDGEVLLGKGISSFIPPLMAVVGSSFLYMALMDAFTHGTLGYYYFPNWNTAVLLFLEVPFAIVMSVEWNVLVSSRVSDVRIAQQVGSLLVLPMGGIYVGGELGVVPLGSVADSLYTAGFLAIIAILLLYVVRTTFQRDAILTKWR